MKKDKRKKSKKKTKLKMPKSSKQKKRKKAKTITIRAVTIDILKRSSVPHKYRTKAKKIYRKSIGSRTVKDAVVRSRISKKRMNKAILTTFKRKSRRILKRK